MIHQHFKLVDVFTATENIVLGVEDGKRYNIKEAEKRVKAITDKYGFNIDLDKKIYNMSVSEKQTVEIIKVLYRGADILILDEPEIHLHSEWQIIYAELIVALQKYFDLTILIVTHSFQFLESLNFFMKKYGISEKGNYYIPKQTEKGGIIEDNDSNLSDMRKSLKSGMFTLADMQLDELSSGDSDEEDDE